MRTAFKEWAVIVEALGRGVQSLILRKGGIAEGRGGFQVGPGKFLLAPTRFHQHREDVTPEGQAVFDTMPAPAPSPETLNLRFIATVTGWRKLESLGEVMRLAGQHVWRPEVIASRFDWGTEQAIHVLALRVARLPVPTVLPMRPEYGGCRSWIELADDVDDRGAIPVLDDGAHEHRMRQLESALGGPLNSSS